MPEMERSFSQFEAEGNRIIFSIIKENNLSAITQQDYCILLFFLVFQYSRTKRGKQEAEQFFNGLYNHIFRSFVDLNIENFKREGIEKDYLDKCSVAVNGPIHALAMKFIMECGPFLIRDLTPILFRNHTSRDFIISDSPIVLYNSFFNNPNGHFLYPFNSTTGLQSPGLQIFWPLNPRLMMILYDNNFYNFDFESKGIVEICSEEDIDALNSLQFFNCSDNILFVDPLQEENIRGLHSKYEELIDKEYYRIDTMTRTKSNGQNTEIIMNGMRDIDYSLILSFMQFNRSAKAIDIARDFTINDFVRQHFKEDDEQIERLFYLGELVVTDEADRILFLEKPKEDLMDLLKRHVSGDWGEVGSEDKCLNDEAVKEGSRIKSVYTLSTGKKIMIITEAANELGHREMTEILKSD